MWSVPLAALLVVAGCGGEGGAPVDAPATDASRPPEAAATADSTGTAAESVAARDRPDAARNRAGTGPEDPGLRVVFLGTSLTAGLGLDRPGDRWPERIGALADSAGLAVHVVNAGVSGDTSAGGLRRLDWLLSEPLDVLVVELGANDGLRGHSPEALEENLRTIIRTTRERSPGTRIVLAGMEAPPNLGADYTERFRAVFPRVAEETGVSLIPFLLEGVAGEPELNQPDGIHPTPAGHRRMARTAWPILESVLRDLNPEGPNP